MAFQALNIPPRQVCAKTSPTFLSSDLFTPFRASPQSSGAEFLRPSYDKSNTWGVVKTSYAGVGSAVSKLEASGKGSISRSHRHYGTGCVNFHAPDQPYNVTELQLSQCRPCDQRLPKPLMTGEVMCKKQRVDYPKMGAYTSHVSKFSVFPSAPNRNLEALTSRTAEALQQLHSALYCTTTYKDTHRNFFTKKEKNPQHHKKYFSVVQTAAHYTDLADGESYEEASTVEVQGMEHENSSAETNMVETSTEEDCQCDAENGNYAGVQESHFEVNGDSTSHVKINNLHELPDHFGRITSKYTTNHSSWPCYIPYYLHRKHTVLPSSITAVPPEYLRPNPPSVSRGKDCPGSGKTGDGGTKNQKKTSPTKETASYVLVPGRKCGRKLPSLTHAYNRAHMDPKTHMEEKQPTSTAPQHNQLPTTTNQFPRLPKIVEDGGEVAVVEYTEVPPLSSLLPPTGPYVSQHLGRRFKSEAHKRYHALHPDSVPDLRETRQSTTKKHFFYGYHTSVFRGSYFH